jgi:type I restriction enzyme R subunit
MSPRPQISTDIQRKLLIECGHRCCVCGEHVSLEKAHIVPWSATKDHSAENLLVLCSLCHTRSHDEKWDQKTLKEYKTLPWVARYKGVPSDFGPKQLLTLKLDTTKEDFEKNKERLLVAIAAVIDASPKDVLTVSVKQGSILLTVAVPAVGAARLLHSEEAQSKLQALLDPIKLLGIEQGAESSSYPDERARRIASFNMYAAYQSGQPASCWPVRFSCSPCAAAARRSAAASSAEEANAVAPASTRPGNRTVTSWSSQPLPSGSRNEAYER